MVIYIGKAVVKPSRLPTTMRHGSILKSGLFGKFFQITVGITTVCYMQADYFFKEIMGIKEQQQINGDIRDREVRVIGENGEQLGIMSAFDANAIAEEKGLDLVKISPTAVPPVCKIMDYGKYRFDMMKREKEAKKNQKTVEVKEIWLSMTIDVGDINVKAKQAQKFLAQGNKVKVSIRMRGRQNAHPAMGIEVMNKFYELVKDVCTLDKKPLAEERNIIMFLGPLTK